MDKSDITKPDFKLYGTDMRSLEKADAKHIKYCDCPSDS